MGEMKATQRSSVATGKLPVVETYLRDNMAAVEAVKNCFKLASVVARECKLSKKEAGDVITSLRKAKRIVEVKKTPVAAAHLRLQLDGPPAPAPAAAANKQGQRGQQGDGKRKRDGAGPSKKKEKNKSGKKKMKAATQVEAA